MYNVNIMAETSGLFPACAERNVYVTLKLVSCLYFRIVTSASYLRSRGTLARVLQIFHEAAAVFCLGEDVSVPLVNR